MLDDYRLFSLTPRDLVADPAALKSDESFLDAALVRVDTGLVQEVGDLQRLRTAGACGTVQEVVSLADLDTDGHVPEVTKCAAATPAREGFLTMQEAIVTLTMPDHTSVVAVGMGEIASAGTTPVASHGDSGALVLHSLKAAGMVLGGTRSGQPVMADTRGVAYILDMQRILTEFDMTLV